VLNEDTLAPPAMGTHFAGLSLTKWSVEILASHASHIRFIDVRGQTRKPASILWNLTPIPYIEALNMPR